MLLDDIGFTATPGEITAIVGPGGAGKSTLLRVLAGVLVPDEGAVRIDDVPLATWHREVLARHLAYMPQTPTFFPGTIHANIARVCAQRDGDPQPDAAVIEAATLAGAHDRILRLPQGYGTRLATGEEGEPSAGERQAIALARALFGSPRIVLLDAPDAHLDLAGQARLVDTLNTLRARRATVIVSSHRTDILEAADRVLVLRDGALQFASGRATAARSTPATRVTIAHG